MAQILVNDDRLVVIKRGNLTHVEIIDYTRQIVTKGYAKLNEEDDVYDEDFGISLALARAEERYHKKLQKALIRSL